MDPIIYHPRGPNWSPRAAINAMYEFKDGTSHGYPELSKLRTALEQVGDVTILNVLHDKNEVPLLTELLCATFIIEHGTGTTFCWCAEYDGVSRWMRPTIHLFDGSLMQMRNTDISRILANVAREMGLFMWNPRLYTSFPLGLFAPPKSSRREFARYLNALTKYRVGSPPIRRAAPRSGNDAATKSTDVRK